MNCFKPNCFKVLFVGALLSFLLPLVGYEQSSTSFKKLSKNEGLSQASVFAIEEDVDGFLWFGTREGLNRYDGYSFKVFRSNSDGSGIAGNDIRTLYSDPLNGDLWIGTLEGLSVYDRSDNVFRSYKNETGNTRSLSSNGISAIIRDSDDQLWVASSSALHYFDPEGGVFVRMPDVEGKLGSNINTLYEDNQGVLWIGSKEGLFQVDKENRRFENASDIVDLPKKNVTTLQEDCHGNLWIGHAASGLTQWNKSSNAVKHYQHVLSDNKSLSHDDVRTICLDQNDQLWIGTRSGLNLFDYKNDNFTTYKRMDGSPSSLSDNSIKSIHCDRKGSLWIGTYYGGVNHLDQAYSQFVSYGYSPRENGLKAPVVSSFAEDLRGNIWIGTEGGGLSFYNRESKTFKSYLEDDGQRFGISGNNVKQILLEGNSLWIGFFTKGLDRFDLKTQKFSNFSINEGLSSANVYDILKVDDWLWLATYNGGLNLLNPITKEVKIYQANVLDSTSLSSDFTRVLFKTKKGEIWVGTSQGVDRIELDEAGFPTYFESYLHGKKIYSIQETSNGQLWIGTVSNGLYLLDTSKQDMLHYTSEDGLSGNTIYGIIEDHEGFLWLSTNNGISRFDPIDKQFVNFNNANGLNHAEFNFNAYAKLSSGEILFGGINGYTRFFPEDVAINDYIPKVAFTDIAQNNQLLKLDKNINEIDRITFKYNEANFTLSFAALDFSNPANNYYSYKLEGLDNDWNLTIGQPSATYTIQRPGRYIFKLKGGNSAGLYNEDIKKLEFVVLPPPWFSWWACLIYFFILALGLFGIIRHLKLQASLEVERKEKEQLDELSSLKLNFFTNVAHEFRTPLTLIIGPLQDLINNLDKVKADNLQSTLFKINKNAQRMLNLVNQLMTFRRMEAGHEPLSVREVKLPDFLRGIFDLFADFASLKNISYMAELDNVEDSAWLDPNKMEKVLFNLLSNAFKFTAEGGKIVLVLEEYSNSFLVKVRDNGAGIPEEQQEQIFQRFYEKNPDTSKNLIKGTGIGLSLSKQLIELHQGKIEVCSSQGKGAEFIVSIPKGKTHFNLDSFSEADYRSELSPLAIKESKALQTKRTLISDSSLKILLVDDNREVVDYLTTMFEGKYKIITAYSGKEGLKKSREYQPDLIVSDVMMPKMNGYQFCREIRSSFETSHIPLILLTAKTILEEKIQGLESGANDFISKPFHPEELQLKIDNLLRQRLDAKKALRDVEFEPSALDITSADEQFLEKLVKLVDDNVSNPDFKIEHFANELAVSRALLFTKIKALTDMTPKNFLKSFRMKRAVTLLESGKLSVHEIAYTVGYKDPKYFSKVFHKEFGKNPSEYVTAFKL